VVLDGLGMLVLFESPQRMYEGGWRQAIYLEERADAAQREALETILKGRAGGPWAILARFVGEWLPMSYVTMEFKDEGRKKSLTVPGLFETEVEAIRGADGAGEASLQNLFNTIHGPIHVLARGKSRCDDRGLSLRTDGSHGLYSHFSWQGP
jgi:hypothetical protein